MYKIRIRIWWEKNDEVIEDLVLGKDTKSTTETQNLFDSFSKLLHSVFGLIQS